MRESIKNNSILVVGGAGFIGSHLVDKLLSEGAKKVIIIDNLFIGNKENLNEAIRKGAILHVDDAENQEALEYIIEKYKIKIVFNCATKPLNYSFINPSNAYLTNVIVLKNLLELQRKKAFQTLCHYSSSEAYGSAQYQPMDEEHPLAPLTTYAAGKAAADLMLQSYVRMFHLDAFIVRPFNNYGPRQNFEGEMAGVIPITIKKILEGEAPEIHGDGKQTRDFIYVEDTADIVLKVFPIISPGESVNITTDQQTTIKTVVENIIDVMNYNGKVLKKPARTADVQSHRGSVEKLHHMVGQTKKTPFKDGITNTVNWLEMRIH
ncbi:dTDP-glucose 4,6-dehydratase [Oceanobacillus bengalensis]|uniref:NAD-dependent epimerase/dehydratase family protein n=1 Tax=Oceanobacillus bengalensis TaxID=1435466 RepID=A0A494Z4T2_9BACI|nr:NAD-dependent epimerase/dehydratase family protein [Oceanobacillus bengalensis]RKQ17550.1 NAD-dependent epimerase/dehydratase family protein [Oceanobacillus bengalensis]